MTRKPTGGQKKPQDMAEAVKALGRDKQKRDRAAARGLRKWGARWTEGWGGRIGLAVVAIILVLLIDGVRREGKEFKATVVSATGKVSVIAADGSGERPVEEGAALRDGDQVRTGPRSTALLTFHDGSAIQVDASTQFEVRLLDFSRGGRRDRSFMVRSGSVLARVGSQFGLGSQATVCTPTTVAAVRGTAFRVTYQPAAGSTRLEVAEGQVEFRTPTGARPTNAGSAGEAAGYAMSAATALGPDARRTMQTKVGALAGEEKPFSRVLNLEWQMTRLADPVLQLLGICPGGWGYNSMDYARRSACMEALRLLQQKVEEQQEPPRVLNPVTLEELNLDPKEQTRILGVLAGRMIDSYKCDGTRFTIRARARDKARTPYQLTNTGVSAVTDGEDTAATPPPPPAGG